jgi:hypothetical protein
MILENIGVTSVSAVAIVPIIVALVQAIKMVSPSGRLNKWSPIISIALGLLASFVFNPNHMMTGEMIMTGVVYGLSASGIYSGVKSSSEAIKGEQKDGTNRF